jgi:hypothetical protein
MTRRRQTHRRSRATDEELSGVRFGQAENVLRFHEVIHLGFLLPG